MATVLAVTSHLVPPVSELAGLLQNSAPTPAEALPQPPLPLF